MLNSWFMLKSQVDWIEALKAHASVTSNWPLDVTNELTWIHSLDILCLWVNARHRKNTLHVICLAIWTYLIKMYTHAHIYTTTSSNIHNGFKRLILRWEWIQEEKTKIIPSIFKIKISTNNSKHKNIFYTFFFPN
jgi:hypothetical protein